MNTNVFYLFGSDRNEQLAFLPISQDLFTFFAIPGLNPEQQQQQKETNTRKTTNKKGKNPVCSRMEDFPSHRCWLCGWLIYPK